MLPGIQTRIGGVNDAGAISDFISALTKRHISPTLDQDGIDGLLASMNVEATRDRLCGDFHFILAFVNDKLVGLAVIRNPSHLYHLFVETDHQRQGIGRNLFAKAQNYVRNRTGSLSMTVNSSLNSIETYLRLGFTMAGDIETINGVRFQPMRWANCP